MFIYRGSRIETMSLIISAPREYGLNLPSKRKLRLRYSLCEPVPRQRARDPRNRGTCHAGRPIPVTTRHPGRRRRRHSDRCRIRLAARSAATRAWCENGVPCPDGYRSRKCGWSRRAPNLSLRNSCPGAGRPPVVEFCAGLLFPRASLEPLIAARPPRSS